MKNYYCNPLNVPYRYQFFGDEKNEVTAVSREAADPSMICFYGKYYIFPSMTAGVWVSDNLAQWELRSLPEGLPFYDYAPDARVVGDYVYLCASSNKHVCDYYRTKDILNGPYERIPGTFPFWDPNLFVDDDGRFYFYWGCSCTDPIYGVELDPETMKPKTEKIALFDSDAKHRGYERNHDDNSAEPMSEKEADEAFHTWCRDKNINESTLSEEEAWHIRCMASGRPYIEGAWMTKHDGKYYLQYAIPGAEYNVYADGVYVSDHPLGPFHPSRSNPYSLKLGGFIEGAGHGSTMCDLDGSWWHSSTMRISINHKFERRVGLWPAGFDREGNLFCNERYGDWPHAVEDLKKDPWTDPEWMLLSYRAEMKASSEEPGREAARASDEDIRSWWRAASSTAGEWLIQDLGEICRVHAVQINFADDKSDVSLPGRIHQDAGRYIDTEKRRTRWLLEGSLNGRDWSVIEDKRHADTCLPHDLVVREEGISLRFLKLTVYEVPFGTAPCISGLRTFGKADRPLPKAPAFQAVRLNGVLAQVELESLDENADGYCIQWGISPDQLYHSKMVFRNQGKKAWITSLVEGESAYIRVDAFGKGGITAGKLISRI